MSNGTVSNVMNTILVFVICLCGGGIIGYMIGDASLTLAPAPTSAPGTEVFSDFLPVEHASIVEGLSCPEEGCTSTLRECQGALPRQIRSWVNQQIAAGRSDEEITAELIQRHSPGIFKLGGNAK